MKKLLLLALVIIFSANNMFSQNERYWSQNVNDRNEIVTDKGVSRQSFPKQFRLFDLNITPLREDLFSIVGNKNDKHSVIISLPNADGAIEQFEVYEASNFEADLQAQFPEIRAYSGKGITDVYATLKISISPQGIQTMIFRTDKENEFIEPYSQDHTIYAVFKSQRQKGSLAWTCSTDDKEMANNISAKVGANNTLLSSAGQLKTMRLAQSCNAEYANYFGATSAAQVGLVLAAFNATLTRCNGVYEKDLALHLNLVASTTNVIYYNPITDPYTTLNSWNTQLQRALNTTLTGAGTALAVNNAAYDIGHMFGASGGGGNAGCIGCVCVDGIAAGTGSTKGRGITSPGDGVPQGDTFDIDYVVHEVGHQLGGNHTFSNSNEGAGVNKEVGSGVTIMGYAGITPYDVAQHSIDIYHETTIEQIQNNLATKTCPITTSLVGANATPVVNALTNYTIPISTPFVLTGLATDANTTDVLTYCWEQNDDGGSSTGANSSASITKTVGPNFLSWSPTASSSRYFPKLSSIIANSNTTAATGNDAGILTEALSSVSRVLNFRLTVRDNVPYSSTVPIKVGQTNYKDMAVTVNSAAGPFLVTAPNSAVSYEVGSNQTVTWNVAGTTANNVNAAFVDIFLSTDGGNTYPIQLASKVPNDGSEIIAIPNNVGTTNRIMVKGYRHIFFDISNTNFAITAPVSTFRIAYSGVDGEQNKDACAGGSTITYTMPYTTYSGFTGATTFSVAGNPAGSTVTFSPNPISADGNVTMTISNTASSPAGLSSMIVTGTSGAITKTAPFYLQLFGAFNVSALSTPANNAVGISNSLNLTWVADSNATMYDVQIATDAAFTTIISSGTATTNSYAVSGLTDSTVYFWRILPKNDACSGVYSVANKFTTGQTVCATFTATNVPLPIAATANATVTSILNITSTDIISDANITLGITHTWINDIKATLTSPSGTSVVLFSNPCSPDSSVNDINATFDDSGSAVVCGNFPGISGTVLPASPLSAFNGQAMNGNWTLTIVDLYSGDSGSLNSWSLNLCKTIAALGVKNNDFQNFVLYPNPNNGSFNVQFNSDSSNQIKIGVYDIAGRQVFSQFYQNNGVFNENLKLNSIQSGVYLVTVEDGESKIVKRIIVE